MDGSTRPHLPPHLPVPHILILTTENKRKRKCDSLGRRNKQKINSPPSLCSSSHLICLVAQPNVPPLQVHLVHGDPPAGRSLLGDASARHSAPREAGGFTVGVVRAPPLGGRATRTEVDRAGVSSGRRRATSCHFGGRWARRQAQSAGTFKVLLHTMHIFVFERPPELRSYSFRTIIGNQQTSPPRLPAASCRRRSPYPGPA